MPEPNQLDSTTPGPSERSGPAFSSRPGVRPIFDVVLHEPEIPNNTGNIGRTCVATGCRLRLIHPLAFDISEKACRRAGLDYWPRLPLREHTDFAEYDAARAREGANLWLLTTKASRSLFDAPLALGDHLVFGKETSGLPTAILERYPEQCLRLPMVPGERSLNLATAVCAVVYEGVRRLLGTRDLRLDASGNLVVPPENRGES